MLNLTWPTAPDADRATEDRRWLALGGVLAGTCLGLALQLSNGILVPGALTLVTVAFALTAAAGVIPRPAHLARLDARVVRLLGLAALAMHLGYLYTSLPAIYLRLDAEALTPFRSGVAVLAIVCASTAWSPGRWAKPLQITALVAAHAALGVWIIHRSPNPAIDVHLFHRYAIDALRSGVDPYAITFPDIYQGKVYYGSGLSADGRLQFGYPYFPFSLLLSMPGQILFKDARFAQLVAVELSALLMTFARPQGLGLMAAALYLTTPRMFFVLEQSWTEPFLVLGVSALVFAGCRRSRLTPWLFGAFVAMKQYLVLALAAAWLLVEAPRDRRRLLTFLTKAAIVGAVLTLPFVLWNPAAFWRSVVTLQFHQPFRPDALSVSSWWAARGHEPPPALISFVVAAAASIVALWRLPRTPAGFAMAIALTFFGFFAFNKQAFANYYFFVIGALYATVAAWRPPEAGEWSRSGRVALEPASPLPRDRRMWMALAALVAAGLIPLVWPGDVPFINDEPQLIASAVKANREGRLAPVGLLGTYGFRYGPAPTWVYQALIPVTRDLVGIAALHILLMSAATAGGIWWLGRSLRLWIWFAPLPLLSPYYWFYARVLWDNPFLLPLGALALAGYAAFLASGSPTGLRVSVAAMLGIPLVHLMGISLVAPLAAHMMIFRLRAVWAHRYSLAAIAAGALWLAWPYWTYLAGPRPAAPGAGPAIAGWLFPLSGGRLLSARELDYFYGPGPVGGRVFDIAAAISSIGYALVWCGIAVAIALMVRAWRHREWTARTHVAAIAVGSLVCQGVVHGITAKFEHPHYHNGAWISSVMLAWFAVDFLATGRRAARRAATATTAVLAASLLLAVGTLAVRLHRSQGTRDTYGPTLANQQQVARALARYPPNSIVQVHVTMWQRFPHTFAILRELNARPRVTRRRRTIELRHASQDPASGAIEMVVR